MLSSTVYKKAITLPQKDREAFSKSQLVSSPCLMPVAVLPSHLFVPLDLPGPREAQQFLSLHKVQPGADRAAEPPLPGQRLWIEPAEAAKGSDVTGASLFSRAGVP